MRHVVTVYCKIQDWANDAKDCFGFVVDYETLPPDTFVVAILEPDREILLPPDEDTMTDGQKKSLDHTIVMAHLALSQ